MYEEKPTKRALEHISGSGDSRECSIYLPLCLLIQFSCNFVNFSDGPVCWYSWQQRRGVPGFLRITSRQDIQIYTRHVSSWPPHQHCLAIASNRDKLEINQHNSN